jgi:hypothetical protein
VIEKEFVEEDLVRVLQSAQIDVSLEVIVFSLVGFISAHRLFFECLYIRWKKAVKAKRGALLLGERCTLVQRLLVEEIHPAWGIRNDRLPNRFYCGHFGKSFFLCIERSILNGRD